MFCVRVHIHIYIAYRCLQLTRFESIFRKSIPKNRPYRISLRETTTSPDAYRFGRRSREQIERSRDTHLDPIAPGSDTSRTSRAPMATGLVAARRIALA